MAPLSTDSYKGVRDFYPEDMFVQEHIFGAWRRAVERFGYQEYGASVLEPAELYRSKTSEEIVNEQTYTFRDRGDREVTLRPEMTPTVARMVAARKRELGFPLRWYSLPNLFRYEQPQRGRLREHWQLNVDVFGLSSIEAEIEIIAVASEIMREFGAKDSDFEISINSRALTDFLFEERFKLSGESIRAVTRIVDRKKKMSREELVSLLSEHLSPKESEELVSLLENGSLEEFASMPGAKELSTAIDALRRRGIENVRFSPSLMRGFDYYTGIVFEVFDTDPENKRALFGGGRYDDLLSLFGGSSVPAAGFGMGDVTIRDFLETHKLLPAYRSSAALGLCVMAADDAAERDAASSLAAALREKGVNVAIDWTGRKIGDQIKAASKLGIPFALVFGEEEAKTGSYKVKNLSTGQESSVSGADAVAALVASALSNAPRSGAPLA